VRGEEYPYESLELKHDDTRKDLRGYHRFLHATEVCADIKEISSEHRIGDWAKNAPCLYLITRPTVV